jgi:transcriptional regulator with XRE-family HTH domain
MSQYQLAEATGIHRAQIGAWELQRHSPTYDSLERLATFFGIDVLRFLAGPDAPRPGVAVGHKEFIEVGLYDGITPLMQGEPSGAILIPRSLKGCVAVRVTEHLPGWRRMAPEVRLGDIWALRPGGRPKDGMLVAVVPKQPSDEGERVPTGGLYRARTKILEACNPSFPSLPAEDFDVVAVAQALLWRDYREGVQR